MKILEHKERVALHFVHLFQGRKRITRRGNRTAGCQRVKSVRHIPGDTRPFGLLAHCFDRLQRALFLQCDEHDQRESGAQINIQFLVESHNLAGSMPLQSTSPVVVTMTSAAGTDSKSSRVYRSVENGLSCWTSRADRGKAPALVGGRR